MKRRFLTYALALILPFILALVSTFAWAPPALAQGPKGDQVVFGDNLVLEAEEKIKGDVLVFGGNVTVPPSSEIDGDLVVFGGNADIKGTVTGDIGMIGGNVNLAETAVVSGDIGLLGGNADVAEGAVVEGEVQSFNRFGWDDDKNFSVPPVPPISPVRPVAPDEHFGSDFFEWGGRVFDFFRYVVEYIALLLALAVVSWLVAAFMPEQMKVVGDTLVESAPLSFGVGLLTSISAGVIGVLLLITICLAFIPALAFILLGIATLFGWIVAGQVIGERLLIAAGQPYPNLISSTLVGVLALTLVANMPIIELIPCLGFILGFLGGLLGLIVALTGLGAVILTRFGTRPYQPGAYAFATGPVSPTGPAQPRSGSPSALDRSEAELRAKIDAALVEADANEMPSTAEPAIEEPRDEPAPDAPGTAEKLPDEQPGKKRPKPKKQPPAPDNDPEQDPVP